MIKKKEVDKVLSEYGTDVRIATVGSHSALQIMKGAKDENFPTLLVCNKKNVGFYEQFNLVDEFITVDSYKEVLSKRVQDQLIEKNAVLIPHGSFVEYVGAKEIAERLKAPMFGNRLVLGWESDRKKQFKWFKDAGLRIPKEYKSPKDIDRLAMVKFPGAKGGRGYFLAKNKGEYDEKMKQANVPAAAKKGSVIQEYIVGTRFYPHFFYSPLDDSLELLGMDIRYESNVDGLCRIPSEMQAGAGIEPSYVVTGNVPVVMRESLLPKLMEDARKLVERSKRLFSPGMTGAFCLEMICTNELRFVYFEVSARIVAGTNIFINGSPYSSLLHKEPMSTGRRIAREIKNAARNNKLGGIVY